MMSWSVYIWVETCWKPIAGPPERISPFTPVYSPFDMRGPETDLFSASTV